VVAIARSDAGGRESAVRCHLTAPRFRRARPVFDGVALGLALGAVCWMLVDATRPIVKSKQDGSVGD